MLLQVEKAQHWYQREIRIAIWPTWLAQWCCEHERKRTIAWVNGGTVVNQCIDCFKTFNETCTHPCGCPHPYGHWRVTSTEKIPTAQGGGYSEVPSTWECTDCGYLFKKDLECPTCHTDMEITEWMGQFSGRFHCQTCGVYYFREDLDNGGK